MISGGPQVTSSAERQSVILVVDDDANNLAVVRDCLVSFGYTILVAEDGESAVKRADYAQPDLILLDVMMPGIDGYETCRRLKALKSTHAIPVLFMTALAETGNKVKGLEAGAVDYITKPFQREELLARIAVHLHNRELTKRLQEAKELLEARVEERTAELAQVNSELHEKALLLEEEIAERVLAEQELHVKQTQLEALNRTLETRVQEELQRNREKDAMMIQQSRLAAMGEMISNISHQWRQPLNELGIMVQMLRVDYDEALLDDTKIDEFSRGCMEIIQYMSQTINTFRNFFKREQPSARFEVSTAISKTVDLVQASFQDAGIKLNLKLDSGCLIQGNANEFSQVILNLFNNARDVLVEREVATPEIAVATWLENGQIMVVVEDNAGGIPDAISGKIFDPYFTTKHKSQGVGLGLYMSKIIIEGKMAGNIDVANSSGGARFQLALPAAPAI
ncbi:Histidine kinase-, DNA gyrase B-, and HSP90-like ATPase [Trichlorobacter thiogenes]|uniref:histidine kinase n=1 Tax=Trichlorobacter thiogenes TaxID=115783 RepID=A0A1T4PJ78_9BACT|nr:response regulator [Trichlorobacter thiogenes]SJZ91522.1 Histidine kinase-, DNA gyrase B-, and HSP90-like ATPase [Trichlorobacter thiogenes]